MRNGEGADLDVADGEDVAGADVFYAREFLGGGLGQDFFNFAMRGFGEIGGGAPFVAHPRETPGMIYVLVGNQNRTKARNADPSGSQPRQCLAR